MTRRDLLALAAAFQTGPRPRNVLLLMTDQHKPDCLGAYGHPVARTPHLDALAARSVRFRSAYCTNPVCTPSRASLLTGLYTKHHKTWSNATPWPFENRTMAHYFRDAGYMTALVGKMHFVDAQTHGFDYRIDFNDWWQHLGPMAKLFAGELGQRNSGSGLPQIDDLWAEFGDPWKGEREPDGRQGLVHPGRVSKIPEERHFDNFIARESVRFLRNHGRKRPFLLISSLLKPHDPFMPAERFAQMFSPDAMRLPATYGRVNLDTVPKEIRASIARHNATPELADEQQARLRMAMYYANLAQADDCLGQILNALKEQGLEDDTVIIYTSDHGEMLGEHGLWQKFVFYEASVGVPLLIRAPGVAPADCREPVSLVDIVPTINELASIAPVENLDGVSLVPQLKAPGRATGRTVFAEYALQSAGAKWMVRHGRWKYTRYADMEELFDLTADPREMRNLAGETGAVLGEMRQRLAAFRAR